MFNLRKSTVAGYASVPIVTVALASVAVVAQCQRDLGNWLAYDCGAIAAGEAWRLLTGHLTHWNGDHLLWDVMMFVVLGVMIERRQRAGLVVAVLASAAAISATLWFCHPEFAEYRGLSGIDSALFMHAAIMLYGEARRSGSPLVCGLLSLSILGFAAKVAYEFLSGSTLFVDSAAAGFIPLAVVHAVGGIVGAASGIAHEILRKNCALNEKRMCICLTHTG